MYSLITINSIGEKLIVANESLAVAESVTSGHLQAALSQGENASLFFQGGITAYNLGQKCRHLKIEPIQAENCDCVSEAVAIKMALEVCTLFTSNWGIGITGYATPAPGKTDDGLFAFYSIAHNGETVVSEQIITQQDLPAKVQLLYTNTVLKDVERLIEITRPIPVIP